MNNEEFYRVLNRDIVEKELKKSEKILNTTHNLSIFLLITITVSHVGTVLYNAPMGVSLILYALHFFASLFLMKKHNDTILVHNFSRKVLEILRKSDDELESKSN